MLYTSFSCQDDLYELRGNSIQSLEWFKLNEKLINEPVDAFAFPLTTEWEVTCHNGCLNQESIGDGECNPENLNDFCMNDGGDCCNKEICN